MLEGRVDREVADEVDRISLGIISFVLQLVTSAFRSEALSPDFTKNLYTPSASIWFQEPQ